MQFEIIIFINIIMVYIERIKHLLYEMETNKKRER